ncbi:MAG: Zn-dependent hydrolase [Candidatus Aminicenantes bacterium]|nr:Zn-dependent hydrolase [Candidatus Aminicenantes bacterium]
MKLQINVDRLRTNLEDLGRIGRDPNDGITRPSFSRADFEARVWLKNKIQDAGLAYRLDGAGNIFGRKDGSGRTVMVGSHIDTVINAGMFDGSVGVLAGLECLRTIEESGVKISRPLELAAFTDEEGNLVGDFLGSRAFIGCLDKELLEKGRTQIGRPLKEILKGTDFTIDGILEAHTTAPDLDAYLELHIEQGPVLDTEDIPVGIVTSIAGKHYRWCSFSGTAGHAGTTPLELRRDAFLGLADFALKSTQHVATHHYGSMVTVGKVQVLPGAFSIVPGQADFSYEFRSHAKETLEALERELFSLADDIAATRGLSFASKIIDLTEPVSIPPRIMDILKIECERLGYPYLPLPSGAGHDAQILAAKADVGMIFIPSPDGVSHSPQETIRWEDLEKGANLLLHALVILAE